MKEKIKFLTRLKKDFMAIMLLLACLPAFANDPLSISISGPAKIFTNDEVTFNASLVGANANACVWTVTGGGSGTPNGRTYNFTAPGSESTVTISCTVSVGSGNNQRTAEDSMTVTVVEPTIVISRKSYTDSSLSDTSPPDTYTITSENGVALIHRNLMGIWEEALDFSISITPADVDVIQFSIDSCDPSKIGICMGYNDSYGHHYNPGGGMKKISEILSDMSVFPLRAWGISCGLGASLSLKINNNVKTTWSYNIYGIAGNSAFAGIEYELAHSKNFPSLVRNEWGLIVPQGNYYYFNGVAYAIKKPPTFNNLYFWVDKVDQGGHNLNATDLSHAFYGLPNAVYPTRYKTTMDTFGDNDGSFSLSDAADFFKSNLWGANKMTTTANNLSDSKIIYYDNHAARKSNLTSGCYTEWHLFESKIESSYIIIHRAEQLLGKKYSSIQMKLK